MQMRNTGPKSPYRFLLFLPTLLLAAVFLQPQAKIRQVDVAQYFAAGHIVRDGKIAALYDHRSYREFVALASGGRAGSLYYNRPAFYALATLPFAYMPYETFVLVVGIGSYALFAAALWLIPRWFPGVPHSRALLLSFEPFLWSVGIGQDTILLTLIVGLGAHLLLNRRKVFLGGAIMALALFKPHIVWAIPLALAAQRRWRALAGFMAVAIFLALLSFALIGANGVEQWIAVLKAPTTDVTSQGMGNVREVAARFGLLAAISFTAITLAALLGCLYRSLPIAMAAALFVGPMLVPHSFLQDYSPAAVSALIAPCPMSYAVLIPWQLFVPGPTSGIPYAITGTAFMLAMAFWPPQLGTIEVLPAANASTSSSGSRIKR
jgi:hypothetical protein